MKILDKDHKDNEELKKLIPIIDDLNKVLKEITLVYRSHKHRETFFSSGGVSIEKKWLQLELVKCFSGVRKSEPLSASIKIETDPEKIKKLNEQFITNYLIWKKEYLKETQKKT